MNLINTARIKFTTPFLARSFARRRSILFVPGDDTTKIQEALATKVDCIAFDCEDSVPESRKEIARETVRSTIERLQLSGHPVNTCIRVNNVYSAHHQDDMRAFFTGQHLPDALIIPRVSSAIQLNEATKDFEQTLEKANKTVDYIHGIESLEAFSLIVPMQHNMSQVSRFKLCAFMFRLERILDGIEMDCTYELSILRQKLLIIARSLHMQALDVAFRGEATDLTGLQKECQQGATMGYDGKQVLFTAHVPQVQKLFESPKQELEMTEDMNKALKRFRKLKLSIRSIGNESGLNQQLRQHFIRRHYTNRRALLYVPGDDEKKLQKALSLQVDCIVMDCEDGVAINRKEAARTTIAALLNSDDVNLRKPHHRRCFDLGVRVNSIDSGLIWDDLYAVLTCSIRPDTILLPKVNTCDDLRCFVYESQSLLMGEPINLIIYIESALAFVNLVEICRETTFMVASRIHSVAVVFGRDDFCADIGAERSEVAQEVLYARQKLVLVARAFQLQPIDMVYIQYKDLEGLRQQCVEGAAMGFVGKQVIHPGQVPIVQEAFLPTAERVQWARGLLEAFEQHQNTGKGAFVYHGSMIDMPTMKQARNIIDLVESVRTNEKPST